MEIVLIVSGIIIMVIVSTVYNRVKRLKWRLVKIRNAYGKKPESEEVNFQDVGNYWETIKKTVPEDECLDDVTWNDLEMNVLFKRINGCQSFVGEQVLYATLHGLPKDHGQREMLEKKISFFAKNVEEREVVQLKLGGIGKNSGDYFLPKFFENIDFYEIPHMWAYRMMQGLLGLSFLPAIGTSNSDYLFLPVFIFVINIVINTLSKARYEAHLDALGGIVGIVNVGRKIVTSKKSSYEDHFHDLKEGVLQFKKLSRMVGALQNGKRSAFYGDFSGMLQEYILGGFLLDFTKYSKILKILKGKQKAYLTLYRKIGELDMTITLASFRESLPFYCLPTFDPQATLRVKEIYHPLIDTPISNDVTLDQSCIITGSNASGKSTYIKAVAINVILAQNIHTCMAKSMQMPCARVITSMAVRDDLTTGESYYIKEIKYLNRIIQSLSQERLVICAIDEILRGTNTQERIAASAAILKFLHTKNCLAIVASHDIELTKMLSPMYKNYHFSEKMEEKDIVFDYRIYDGPSTSRNAIKLLAYVGFPDEIVRAAQGMKVGEMGI